MNHKTRNLIANNVRYFRQQKNWSQEKLAEEMNSSFTYISQIENSKRKVSSDFLDQIANAFDIEPHELLLSRDFNFHKRIIPQYRNY